MNKLNKCPKFEKKYERECTANFCFCPSNVSHNLGWKNQMIREISSHCDKNSAHNVGGKCRWIPLLMTLMVGTLTFLELLWLTLWGKKAKSSGLKWIWHYPNFHPLLVYWWRLPIVKVQDSAATQSARHLYIKHWKSLHTI